MVSKEKYMKDLDKYRQFLIQRMSKAKIVSGGKQIACRCPECGDSVHKSSTHLYISLPKEFSDPSLYYCHLCNSSGIINHRKLIEWNIFDPDIALWLEEKNKSINTTRFSKYTNTSGHMTYLVRNEYVNMDGQSRRKLDYIANRIGVNISFEEAIHKKIVLNLKDILNQNEGMVVTREPSIINDLDREFIGFLSIDNAYLNMRRICPKGYVYKTIDKRYINYKLFDIVNNSRRFYTIPTTVNVNVPYRIPLHIAEGPFDILSIYYNLRDRAEGIYTSIGGSNYLNTIMYFLLDIRLPNIELHMYPDNDQYGSWRRLEYVVSKIADPTIPVFIHRNTQEGEKDFGVVPARIKETVSRMR